MFKDFSKICGGKFKFHLDLKKGTLHEHQQTLSTYLAHFFLE